MKHVSELEALTEEEQEKRKRRGICGLYLPVQQSSLVEITQDDSLKSVGGMEGLTEEEEEKARTRRETPAPQSSKTSRDDSLKRVNGTEALREEAESLTCTQPGCIMC